MLVVDTNLLLYAADTTSSWHEAARGTIEEWRTSRRTVSLTWGIVYEFLRVATHPRVFPSPLSTAQAWDFLAVLLDTPGWQVLVAGHEHRAWLERSMKEVPTLRANLFHDFHTAVLMREHGVTSIYTNDMDFHRFPWVKVTNPLA